MVTFPGPVRLVKVQSSFRDPGGLVLEHRRLQGHWTQRRLQEVPEAIHLIPRRQVTVQLYSTVFDPPGQIDNLRKLTVRTVSLTVLCDQLYFA